MHALSWSRGVALILIGCLGISPLAFASSDNGTLTVGTHIICIKGISQESVQYGFVGTSAGSYSPPGLTGGESVTAIEDNIVTGAECGTASHASVLTISGFSVDPGQDWVSSIECNGVTNEGSGAANYSYSSGVAMWIWSQLFGFMGNSSVSCTINHS